MRVLVLKDNEFIEKDIPNTLEALQKEVGGYIEIPYLSRKLSNADIDIICNEEGKLMGLQAEIALVNHNGNIIDVVCGPCVFASHDEEGNSISLTASQMEIVKNMTNAFIQTKNGVVAIKVLSV